MVAHMLINIILKIKDKETKKKKLRKDGKNRKLKKRNTISLKKISLTGEPFREVMAKNAGK